ncbi:hypothetical protein HPP92_015224 [Vanilla planifolia]|uniref:Oligopeptide transporter n=1 Tax=Vanilla planifolia TaxID=51239 RepID=A0A835UVK8_VANPL|nr:hypothetical protein HPP92_015224 [Vanilla planifolia]
MSLTKSAFSDRFTDVHTRIMKRNYETIPQWWFHVLLVLMFGLAIFACEGFNKQLQLPYWGVLLAGAVALLYTLPVGIIQATTNQQVGLNVITELVIGYIYPGKPLANVSFKTYGYISMSQAITFIQDFKLGHYMKIPPKSMFLVQLVGTVIASSVYFSTAWWLLDTVSNICDPSKLPEGSPWTCPGDDVFYNASIIWGVVAPLRMFGRLGLYSKLNYFFLVGFLSPIPLWVLSRVFPGQRWIKLINMPIILGATSMMPPAKAVNYPHVGLGRSLLQHLCVQEVQGVVGEEQLCSVGGSRCRGGVYGHSYLLCAAGQEHLWGRMVGVGDGPLPLGEVPDGSGCSCRRLSCHLRTFRLDY